MELIEGVLVVAQKIQAVIVAVILVLGVQVVVTVLQRTMLLGIEPFLLARHAIQMSILATPLFEQGAERTITVAADMAIPVTGLVLRLVALVEAALQFKALHLGSAIAGHRTAVIVDRTDQLRVELRMLALGRTRNFSWITCVVLDYLLE